LFDRVKHCSIGWLCLIVGSEVEWLEFFSLPGVVVSETPGDKGGANIWIVMVAGIECILVHLGLCGESLRCGDAWLCIGWITEVYVNLSDMNLDAELSKSSYHVSSSLS